VASLESTQHSSSPRANSFIVLLAPSTTIDTMKLFAAACFVLFLLNSKLVDQY